MRILTLTLKNFRSLQETVLDLERSNFVRGPNGCGKSSIQMALEYLFTGRCQMEKNETPVARIWCRYPSLLTLAKSERWGQNTYEFVNIG